MARLADTKAMLKRVNENFLKGVVRKNTTYSFEEILMAALGTGSNQAQIKTDLAGEFTSHNSRITSIDNAPTMTALKAVWTAIILNRADRLNHLNALGPGFEIDA